MIKRLTLLTLCLTLSVAALIGESSRDETLARYARHGADVWARNPSALISGEGRACISCHTSMPYALVEPLLDGDYPAYREMIANVDDRIVNWSENTPWYADEKLEQLAALSNLPPDALKGLLDADDSRGVEAIFNALIRATHDAYAGEEAGEETRLAFEQMWGAQIQEGPASGRWGWIQANLIPWEVTDSDIWGASMACVAASVFPELAPDENLELLKASLRRAASDSAVSLHTKASILWCDADCCPNREIRPDAYATGFVTLVLAHNMQHLLEGGGPLDRAIAWIDRELANPYPDGPRFNKHMSGDGELPEFRNNLYTNAGHMWSFLAREAFRKEAALWGGDGRGK